MTLQYFLHNAWLWKCGLPEDTIQLLPSFDELQKTEWNKEFEILMRNRLIMGAMRYGRMGAKDKPKYDRVGSMLKRLNKYHETGNKEILVDVANLCLMEFVECNHPLQHFHAIDENDHVSKINL
jgi:hypothetical protein